MDFGKQNIDLKDSSRMLGIPLDWNACVCRNNESVVKGTTSPIPN